MLEQRLKPEVRSRLNDIYKRGQILLNSGLVQDGFSFQRALEDFYGLRWEANSTGYIIHGPRNVEILPPLMILERKIQDDVKLGQIPRDLVQTLDTFGNNTALGYSTNDRDLTYERVREAYAPDYSRIERNHSILFHGSMTVALTSFLSTFYLALHNQNMDHLKWTIPLMVISMAGAFIGGTSSIVTKQKVRAQKKASDNPDPEVERRKDAFWRLHELSKRADGLLQEYRQYFN